jgi:hypothetical protein
MPRAKATKATKVARFRVTLPEPVYDRLQVIADGMGMDVPTLVRIMSSLQLVQWENLANPMRMMSPEVQQAVASNWVKETATLFPDAPGLEQDMKDSGDDRVPVELNPPAAAPADAPRFGFKPKGELDDFPVWVPTQGYMAGL